MNQMQKPVFHKPKFLYHGTALERAKRILHEGLLPATESGYSGNPVPGDERYSLALGDYVTLTDCIALPYALGLSGNVGDQDGAILKIDFTSLNEDLIYPTLAYVAQKIAYSGEQFSYVPQDANMLKLEKSKRIWHNLRFNGKGPEQIERFKSDWLICLESLAECYYRGAIPPSAIRDARVVTQSDKKKRGQNLIGHELDSSFIETVRPFHLAYLEQLFNTPDRKLP